LPPAAGRFRIVTPRRSVSPAYHRGLFCPADFLLLGRLCLSSEGNPEFSKLLSGRPEIDLVQFMLELAADAYPDLDRIGCLMEIDRLGVSCCDYAAAQASRGTRARLTAISQFLYGVEGFHGNRDDYYEPQNSYLNEILARRCGIPISLGILYMAVAARAGVKMFGVNTPAISWPAPV